MIEEVEKGEEQRGSKRRPVAVLAALLEKGQKEPYQPRKRCPKSESRHRIALHLHRAKAYGAASLGCLTILLTVSVLSPLWSEGLFYPGASLQAG